MKITSIIMRNFRSYEEITKIDNLSEVNSFVGPNGAGKSNIMEALKLIQLLARTKNLGKSFAELAFDRNSDTEIEFSISFRLSDSERNRLLNLLFKENKTINLEDVKKTPFFKNIAFNFSLIQQGVQKELLVASNFESDYVLVLSKNPKSNDKNTIEAVTANLEEKCRSLSRLENLVLDYKRLHNAQLSFGLLDYNASTFEKALLEDIRKFIFSWSFHNPMRRILPRMESGEEKILDPTGSNLTKFMNSIQSNDPRKFIKIIDEILRILPSLKDLLAPLRQKEATIEIKEEGLTTPTEIGNASYGIMQTIILVVGILTKANGSVILIEEPELNLHATSQRRLFSLIQNEARTNNKQFFLTTHSTIFTSCNGTNSTYVLTKREGRTLVRKLELGEMHAVKECLGHKNIDLFGDECVVFVEGDSEEIAFPIMAKSMGIDLQAKGIRLINVKGKGKATKLHEYLRYLKDSDVISYVIADGDKELKDQIEDWQREGLIMPNNWTIWDLEFEDCFTPDLIAGIVKQMYRERGIELNVNPEQLRQKNANISMVKILKRILHEQDLDLDKPELAERIAFALSENIGEEGHKETLPEIEIKKIVELVDKDFPFADFQKDVKPEKAYSVEEIRKRYPRAYHKWTSAEDDELSELYQDGVSVRKLAERFQRKQGAIRSRLNKLGLQQ